MKTIEQRLYDGDRAREILENEVFQSVWSDIEKEMTQSWLESPARDEEGRERIWTYLQMLQKVKAHITQTMETGKLAKLKLQHKQTIADRAKAGMRSLIEW